MDQFFPKTLRKLALHKPILKRNAQNEKRIKIDFIMPLDGENIVGIPDYVAGGFEAVSKNAGGVIEADLGTELANVSIDFYDTETNANPSNIIQSIEGAQIVGLKVKRSVSEGDVPKDDVSLYFSVQVTGSTKLWNWTYPYAGATLWAKFDTTQATLSDAKAEEDEPEGEEESTDKQMPLQPAENREAVNKVRGKRPTLSEAAKKKPAKKKAAKKKKVDRSLQ